MKVTNPLVLVSFFLFLLSRSADAQLSDYAAFVGGSNSTIGEASVISAEEDLYVIGRFSSEFTNFGNNRLKNHAGAGTTCFISKTSEDGALQWAKDFGGENNTAFISIHSWKDGNVLVTGNCNGKISYDNKLLDRQPSDITYYDYSSFFFIINAEGELVDYYVVPKMMVNGLLVNSSFEILAHYSVGGFVQQYFERYGPVKDTLYIPQTGMIKMNSSFDVLWSKYFPTFVTVYSWKLDNQDNIYTAIGMQSTDLDTSVFKGAGEAILAKFDITGKLIWLRSGKYGTRFLDIEISGERIYASAQFSNASLIFNGVSYFPWITAKPEFNYNALISLDREGENGWARLVGNDNRYLTGIKIAGDGSGNIVLAGMTDRDTICFDQEKFYSSGQLFLYKIKSDGSLLWKVLSAKVLSGKPNYGSTGISDLRTDYLKNIYLSGEFMSDSLYFGDLALKGSGVQNIPFAEDAFLISFDSDGKGRWSKQVSTNGRETISTFEILSGKIYAYGYTNGTLDFSDFIHPPAPDTLPGAEQFFIVTYKNSTVTSANVNLSVNEHFRVVPNPVTDQILLSLRKDQGVKEWYILNSMGEIVLQGMIRGEDSLVLPDVPEGLYYLMVKDSGSTSMAKFIKK